MEEFIYYLPNPVNVFCEPVGQVTSLGGFKVAEIEPLQVSVDSLAYIKSNPQRSFAIKAS
jgi:hypothetical protein